MGIFIRDLHSIILLVHVFFTNPHYLRRQCRRSISDPSSHTHIRYIDTQYECRCWTWWIGMAIFIRDLHSIILLVHVFVTNPHYLRRQCRQSISFPSSHTHTRYIDTQYECRWRTWRICIDISSTDLHSPILLIHVYFSQILTFYADNVADPYQILRHTLIFGTSIPNMSADVELDGLGWLFS